MRPLIHIARTALLTRDRQSPDWHLPLIHIARTALLTLCVSSLVLAPRHAIASTVSTAPLVVNISGSRTVTTGLSGATQQTVGSDISIFATPASGYLFSGWSGDITTGSNPLDFTFQGPTTLQANFKVAPPFLLNQSDQFPLQFGTPFSFQIEPSTGIGPFTYAATGLPNGVSLDPDTGLISGALDDAGNFVIHFSATNAGGTGNATDTFSVNARLQVTSSAGGSTLPSGLVYLPENPPVTLTAYPFPGYFFKN